MNQYTLIRGKTDLKARHPALAEEWDGIKNGRLTPEEVQPGSTKKVWWRCRKGHSWQAAVSSRVAGKGCPYCAGRKVMPGFNDLAAAAPELAAQWDYGRNGGLRPEDVTGMSQRPVWWAGRCGHSWNAKVSNRRNGCGCPYCSGKKVLEGFNDAQSRCPELMGGWDFEKNAFLPSEITAGSRRDVWWRCTKGHSWKAEVYFRARGSGCPVCARLIDRHPVVQGESDLAAYSPRLAAEWDCQRNVGLTPEQVRPFSTRKVWWVCEKGHHWQCAIQIRQKGTGCPFCNGRIHGQSRLI